MKQLVVKIFSKISNKGFAAGLFNLICLLAGKKVRVRLDENNFILPNGFRFIWPGRSFAYVNGTQGRLERLGADYLLQHVDFKDGDRVVDCGANIGELLLCLEAQLRNIKYLAFEPSPEEFNVLKKNAGLFEGFHIELRQVALSDQRGRISFYVKSNTADSSIFPIENAESEIEVNTELLADFLNETTKFLKLEAEGAEPEVLKGAGEAIRNVEFIACDCGPERGLAQQHTIAECVNYLSERDFELIDVCLTRFVFLFKNKSFSNN